MNPKSLLDRPMSTIPMNANSTDKTFLARACRSLPIWMVSLAVTLATSIAPCRAGVADGYLQRWVTKRTKQMKSSFQRGEFESMGWASTIGEAFELAAKHKRPVFLFTLDGHMNSGRC